MPAKKPNPFIEKSLKRQTSRKGPWCTVGAAMAKMPEEVRQNFQEAMYNFDVHASVLAEVITEEGYPLKSTPIIRHRKKQCICEEDERVPK